MEKNKIVATIIQIGVLVMMNTHLYSFNGKTFLQKEGGPIGLRSTCAVARVVMNEWDTAWLERLEMNNIVLRKGERYMDDLRAFLRAIKPGWRWHEGGLYHCEAWMTEDSEDGRSKCRRTGDVLLASMNDIMDFLVFTLEIHEDFEDQKLPTLDTVIYMEAGRIIHFEFFKKPMSSNTVLHAKTALSETVKISSLKEEVVRRLKHTSERLGHAKRMETLEDLSQMMMNSGHSKTFIKSILIGGIMRFEHKLKQSKLEKSDPGYRPLHQPSGRCKKRLRIKAMQKGNWFRDGPRSDKEVNIETRMETCRPNTGRGQSKNTFRKAGSAQQMTTSTVMIVPNTKGGLLVNRLKVKEPVWCDLTGFRVKYAEAGGTPLINMFNQDTGKGAHCNREVCHPCDSTIEEKRQNCRERSVLYETSCKLCNPETKKPSNQQEALNDQAGQRTHPPGRLGVYLGETSRSLHERMAEHVEDAVKFRSGSHIVKHWMEEHKDLGEMPPWRYRTIQSFKDCLTRQLTEAIAISLSNDSLLNGKCDYLTNCISRVTVDEDAYEKKKREIREEADENERLLKIEEFKQEKLKNMTGIKRKRSPSLTLKTNSLPAIQSDQLNRQENILEGWSRTFSIPDVCTENNDDVIQVGWTGEECNGSLIGTGDLASNVGGDENKFKK